jgi:hypothetical protein
LRTREATDRQAIRLGALGVVGLVVACSPSTTRPDFRPFPQALTAILIAPPGRVVPVVDSLVQALGVRVKASSTLDGYVESDWYDTATQRSFREGRRVPDLKRAVKLRCWADPYVPGETTITIEAAFRPRVDPSRSERDLEVVAPDSSAGQELALHLLDDLKKRLGTPTAPSP